MTREWGAVRRYGVAGRVQVTTVKTIHTLSPPLPHHFHCWFFPFWLIIFVESEQQLKKEFHYIFLRQSSVPLSLRPFKKKKKKNSTPAFRVENLFTSRPSIRLHHGPSFSVLVLRHFDRNSMKFIFSHRLRHFEFVFSMNKNFTENRFLDSLIQMNMKSKIFFNYFLLFRKWLFT